MERWTGRETGRAVGYGIDAAPQLRPGVPRERNAPDPGAHWERPEQRGASARSRGKGSAPRRPCSARRSRRGDSRGWCAAPRTASPSTAPPAGCFLVAADRIDMLEHRLARGLWLLPAAVALAAGYAVVARALRRRS